MNTIRIVNSVGFVTTIETDASEIEVNGVKVSIPVAEIAESSTIRVFSFEPDTVNGIAFIKALRTATHWGLTETKNAYESLQGQLYDGSECLPSVAFSDFRCKTNAAAAEFGKFLGRHGIHFKYITA